MNREAAYWMAMAHLPRWGSAKINRLIVRFYHENKITLEDFFQLSETDWYEQYGLEEKEIADLREACQALPNYAFLAEALQNEGIELIPVISPEYPDNLKRNLKIATPVLLYLKGNKQILKEKSIAIVGSRKAAGISLMFTDRIASLAYERQKVVVSGFAKGVDKQALDSALKYGGHSIIVLPQGMTTFGSGFKTYYKQIIQGKVVVVSVFPPKAPWSTGLAMARNPIIYGLADEIYVAESAETGGTWMGVTDGLKRGRVVYVRKPEAGEKNANGLLIHKGAKAVDINGELVYSGSEQQSCDALVSAESMSEYVPETTRKIAELLKTRTLSVKQIKEELSLEWSEQRIRECLKDLSGITSPKRGKYTVTAQLSLF